MTGHPNHDEPSLHDMYYLPPRISCGPMCEAITSPDPCNPDAWVALGAKVVHEPGFTTPPEEAAQAGLLMWLHWRTADPAADHWTYCLHSSSAAMTAYIDGMQRCAEFFEAVPAAKDLTVGPDRFDACERQLRKLAFVHLGQHHDEGGPA